MIILVSFISTLIVPYERPLIHVIGPRGTHIFASSDTDWQQKSSECVRAPKLLQIDASWNNCVCQLNQSGHAKCNKHATITHPLYLLYVR